ncbi:KH domain-containing protein [Marinococcus sp. PL1-022]|uniref:KH domain-containing protein n=1 Tax=Marinococcus sp. PL1-022 TaxID=3095363 RepID=UPI0029C3FE06|nr:KH domain-containing protein [Marinococcus sp. PL1-022]MDX6152441.1 KH domain-containing protein [Marinococcus sp. PL1-022]
MKSFAYIILERIVDYPDDIDMTESEENGRVLIEVRVHPEDAGKVIGRQGKTIQAVRTLLQAKASAEGKNVRLRLLNDQK